MYVCVCVCMCAYNTSKKVQMQLGVSHPLNFPRYASARTRKTIAIEMGGTENPDRQG